MQELKIQKVVDVCGVFKGKNRNAHVSNQRRKALLEAR